MDRLLYRPAEAGEVLGLSRSRIYELIASGDLESVTVGSSRRIPGFALQAFIEHLRATTAS